MTFFRSVIQLLATFFTMALAAQFPPPAGQPGTTAIHQDSSIIIGWATNCSIERGYINIADTNLQYNGSNRTTFGSILYVTGPADQYVVSLGDKGIAILEFVPPISNGPRADFAVFENSFSDSFLELAFVEVSSDGQHFVRFPAISVLPVNSQIGTFDTLDATMIHNFAGKYRMGYGTPFDLDDLKDSSGVDLSRVTHIRIVDAIGNIDPAFAVYDANGNKVNDPWPTPFDTGGFDLDAVGVIHNTVESTGEIDGNSIFLWPNPCFDNLNLTGIGKQSVVEILTITGEPVLRETANQFIRLSTSDFARGIYLIRLTSNDGVILHRKFMKF